MDVSIFRKKMGIEKQIDDFLDQVSESGLIYQQGIEAYLHGDLVEFQRKLDQISEAEHKGDSLRRAIEEFLYIRTLIPFEKLTHDRSLVVPGYEKFPPPDIERFYRRDCV